MHLLTSALDVNYIIPIHIASPECHPTVWELYAPHITHSMSVRGDSIASLRLVSLDQLRTPIYMPICVGKAPRKRWVGPSLYHWIYSTILSWYQHMFLVLQVIPSTLGQCACTLR